MDGDKLFVAWLFDDVQTGFVSAEGFYSLKTKRGDAQCHTLSTVPEVTNKTRY